MAKQTKQHLGTKRERSAPTHNRFEEASRKGGIRSNKRLKHDVINRNPFKNVHNNNNRNTRQTLTQAEDKARKTKLIQHIRASKKSNSFKDNRIDGGMNRVIRERMNRSKRMSKFQLNDDDGNELTHGGQVLDPNHNNFELAPAADDDGSGDGFDKLDAADTELHFGGGGGSRTILNHGAAAYGAGSGSHSLGDAYRSRKVDLDDIIMRSKLAKQEKQKEKRDQVNLFEKADAEYGELKSLLQFRGNENEAKKSVVPVAKKKNDDMDEWNAEMKSYLFERRMAATDRTKTPEEIAKEASDRLHELEKKRLARMAGEDDELSDIASDDDGNAGPEDLGESKPRRKKEEVVFTEDGLLRVRDGKVVDSEEEDDDKSSDGSEVSEESEDSNDDDEVPTEPLNIGQRVKANYHASEAYMGISNWFKGTVIAKGAGNTYTIRYDDGDDEDAVRLKDIRLLNEKRVVSEKKRRKAKDIARKTMPFVFTVPPNIDDLHDMVGEYCETGKDAATLIERIYIANSVRLNRNNMSYMVNFLDILQKRFLLVADALSKNGDDNRLARQLQLNELTKVMYKITQEAPNQMSQIWSRRLIYFQRSLGKSLRDLEIGVDTSAVPSLGQLLLLRCMGHIFPMTDYRHVVATPTMLLLGQYLAQSPILCVQELCRSMYIASMSLEYTKETQRIFPEVVLFLDGVLFLFRDESEGAVIQESTASQNPMPTIRLGNIRKQVIGHKDVANYELPLHIEHSTDEELVSSILFATMKLVRYVVKIAKYGSIGVELLQLLKLSLKSLIKTKGNISGGEFPSFLSEIISDVYSEIKQAIKHLSNRKPLYRSQGPKQMAIKSFAPNMEDPDSYKMSKDKSKNQQQAQHARLKREYRREHKAVQRELRVDSAVIENQRRSEKGKRDSDARLKRQQNFAWMENEQGLMNQQVRQGGELLSGGGTGAARARVKRGTLGIKKGGKMR